MSPQLYGEEEEYYWVAEEFSRRLVPVPRYKYRRRKKRRTLLSALYAPPPKKPRKRKTTYPIICTYPGCVVEATRICPYCYMPYCHEHISPLKHHCERLDMELDKLKDVSKLRQRLIRLGKNLAASPHFEYLWKTIPSNYLIQKLVPLASKYREFVQEFIDKAKTTPQKITKCDIARLIYARLVSKLVEHANKYPEVIVMDQGLLQELSTKRPRCEPKLAGIAFQWWLTLEILDNIQEKGYTLNNPDPYRRKIIAAKENDEIILYIDSIEIVKHLGLRPDILSTKNQILNAKIIEMKLSTHALNNSWNQITKYIQTWRPENIIIAIALPHTNKQPTYNIETIDNIILMNHEKLQKTLNKLTNHLTTTK